jgi:hypothetical protein
MVAAKGRFHSNQDEIQTVELMSNGGEMNSTCTLFRRTKPVGTSLHGVGTWTQHLERGLTCSAPDTYIAYVTCARTKKFRNSGSGSEVLVAGHDWVLTGEVLGLSFGKKSRRNRNGQRC